MQLQAPNDVKSINIGGVEYTSAENGMIEVSDPSHIEAAIQNGYTIKKESDKPVAKSEGK